MGCEALGLPGHFAIFSVEERGEDSETHPPLPRYDVSWVSGKAVLNPPLDSPIVISYG